MGGIVLIQSKKLLTYAGLGLLSTQALPSLKHEETQMINSLFSIGVSPRTDEGEFCRDDIRKMGKKIHRGLI